MQKNIMLWINIYFCGGYFATTHLSVAILLFFINEVNQFFRNWLCNIEGNEIDA